MQRYRVARSVTRGKASPRGVQRNLNVTQAYKLPHAILLATIHSEPILTYAGLHAKVQRSQIQEMWRGQLKGTQYSLDVALTLNRAFHVGD